MLKERSCSFTKTGEKIYYILTDVLVKRKERFSKRRMSYTKLLFTKYLCVTEWKPLIC